MPVYVDILRKTVFFRVLFEAIHKGECALIVVELGKYPASGVIYVTHKHAFRTSSFKPVMVRAVYLLHLAIMMFSFSPVTMRPFFTDVVWYILLFKPAP